MSAREAILGRVRDAIAPAPDTAPEIPRQYRTATSDGVDTFIARLHEYHAQTQRVPAGRLDEAVRATLGEHNIARLVAPDGISPAWLAGIEPMRDSPPLEPHELDAADGVLTGCAVAVAETGTIILDGGSGMGRRVLTLVPDYHLCIVRAEQIVGCLPQALAQLEPTRPLTFISGPSATVDIEMVLISGVHGPRRLEVIVAE